MRIAEVSPLTESVPPQGYGGTERVVSHLTEELVRLGHEVTLFAAGDSRTGARLVAPCRTALRTDESVRDQLPYHLIELGEIMSREEEFDVVHFHTDCLHFPLTERLAVAHLTTMHGRLDLPDLKPLFSWYRDLPLVSISKAQQLPLPEANWVGTVHHGLPPDLFKPGSGSGGYAVFLGRISPEKRLDRAVEIAGRAGFRLKVAAKVDKADEEYFRTVRHCLQQPHVEFVGEIGDKDKQELLGEAACLLFPIDWPEPFGLVLIESMACGTPVIAFSQGSVPEIIDDGENGFLAGSVPEAVSALEKLDQVSRRRCREVFDRRFSIRHVAEGYLRLFRYLQEQPPLRRTRPSRSRMLAAEASLAGQAGVESTKQSGGSKIVRRSTI